MTFEQKSAEESPSRGSRNRLLGMFALLLALLSLPPVFQDRRFRNAAGALERKGGIGGIRPAEGWKGDLEPSGDLAADETVQALVKTGALSGDLRRRARDLMLDAVRLRPGWARHRYLLGLCDESGAHSRARRVLLLSAQAAPGLDASWIAAAQETLDTWPELAPAERAAAPDLFRRALANTDFAASEFRSVVEVVGRSPAMALLPDNADVLKTSAGVLAENGDVPGSATLLFRAEKAERHEREEGLARLERWRALNDMDRLRSECPAYFDQHPFGEFDDPAGHRQLARLLAVWPDDRLGHWPEDRRVRLVRFFLDGRASDVPAGTLVHTVDSMDRVPDAIRARVYLLAGNRREAEALAGGGDRTSAAEWEPFYLELGRQDLDAGRFAEARAALARLSPASRNRCDALLLGRALARATHDLSAEAAAEELLAEQRSIPREDWASRGLLPLCFDPESSAGNVLEITVGSGSPAIASYGWEGGRVGTVFLSPGAASFQVPLLGISGKRSLWASFLVGGEGRSLKAALRHP